MLGSRLDDILVSTIFCESSIFIKTRSSLFYLFAKFYREDLSNVLVLVKKIAQLHISIASMLKVCTRVFFFLAPPLVVSHGALTVPSGFVPGDGEVDFELSEGLDCVPKSVVEVLLAIVQGPDCNFFSCVGPDVSRVVSLADF